MKANGSDTFHTENVDDEAFLGVLSSRALCGRRGIGYSIYVTDKRLIAAYRGKFHLVYPFVIVSPVRYLVLTVDHLWFWLFTRGEGARDQNVDASERDR